MSFSFQLKRIDLQIDGRKLPGSPIVQIALKDYSVDDNGVPVVTPDCHTLIELMGQIERLKRELGQMAASGKKLLP